MAGTALRAVKSIAPEAAEVSTSWPVISTTALTEGKLHRPAIGLLELSTEIVMNSEIRAFLPRCDYGLYTSRVRFGDRADVAGLASMAQELAKAADLLPASEWLDAIVYGCTSGSMVIGPDRIGEIVGARRPGLPVFNPISAVVAALSALGKRRVAVVTPYPQEVNRVVRECLESQDVIVVAGVTFDILSGYEMSRLTPRDLYAAAREADCDEAEVIFISCTALCVSPILEDLERDLGKPVLSSNQALAWQCCEVAGVRRSDGRGGALFGQRAAAPR